MKSKKLIIGLITLMTAFVLSACAGNNENKTAPNNNADTKNEANENMNMNEKESMEGMEGMENDHRSDDEVVSLNDSTGENELKMPPVLESDNKKEVVYTVRAQKGETEIFDGTKTQTYGYNGAFLGPVLRFSKGDTVKIRTINELDEIGRASCRERV